MVWRMILWREACLWQSLTFGHSVISNNFYTVISGYWRILEPDVVDCSGLYACNLSPLVSRKVKLLLVPSNASTFQFTVLKGGQSFGRGHIVEVTSDDHWKWRVLRNDWKQLLNLSLAHLSKRTLSLEMCRVDPKICSRFFLLQTDSYPNLAHWATVDIFVSVLGSVFLFKFHFVVVYSTHPLAVVLLTSSSVATLFFDKISV